MQSALNVFSQMSRRSLSTSASCANPRHFLSIADITPKQLDGLLYRSAELKKLYKTGGTIPYSLKDETVAMMFSKRSTRTRVSCESGIRLLGGHPMFLGKDDIQLGVNESVYDTGKVISSMVSLIIARVGAHKEVTDLAAASSVPVINALSDLYHPLQALADLLTIQENFETVKGLKLAWVGDANNVLYDLMIACSKIGIDVSIATPSKYPVPEEILSISKEASSGSNSIQAGSDPLEAVRNADIIVTDTWVSMGQESEKAQRLKEFKGYQVTEELASQGGAKQDWKFMHCLPRKPEEVSDEVFYGKRSLVFPEAENRKWTVMAVMEWLREGEKYFS